MESSKGDAGRCQDLAEHIVDVRIGGWLKIRHHLGPGRSRSIVFQQQANQQNLPLRLVHLLTAAANAAKEADHVAGHLVHDGRRGLWMAIFQGFFKRNGPLFLKMNDRPRLHSLFKHRQGFTQDSHLLLDVVGLAQDMAKGKFDGQGPRRADFLSPKRHIGNKDSGHSRCFKESRQHGHVGRAFGSGGRKQDDIDSAGQ